MRYILLLLAAIFIVLFFIDQHIMLERYFMRDGTREKTIVEDNIPTTKIPSQAINKIYLSGDHNNTTEYKIASDTAQISQPTIEERLSILGAHIGDPIFIRIFKLTAELEIWIEKDGAYQLLYNYTICRQSGYLGPKLKEGDLQGPEGFYYVTKSRLNPNSKFHLSFNIGYPNLYDRAYGRTGSALMVHGDCVSIGCFAMTDDKIEEIYELTQKSLYSNEKIVRVHIFPFRMTDEKIGQYRDHKWYEFWSNLKEGYDYFELNRVPPNVVVVDKRYYFNNSDL